MKRREWITESVAAGSPRTGKKAPTRSGAQSLWRLPCQLKQLHRPLWRAVVVGKLADARRFQRGGPPYGQLPERIAPRH
jgi:hypothetical protein